MMGGKSSLFGTWLAITSIILVLLVSCSRVSPSPNIQSSPGSVEIIPSPTTTQRTPNLTYPDLNELVDDHPAFVDNSGYPITPIEDLNITGTAIDVDITSYKLIVDGLVDNPLTLNYEEIQQFTPTTKVVLLICPEFFVDNAEWTGVPVKTILTKAGINSEARQVFFYSLDGYPHSLSLQDAQKDGVFLAYKVNGQTLPKEHGYPLRLVIEGVYGGTWVKWLGHIEVK
jgi:DMSO/TMAO reductase YedYZ molybdopterin-dependent catalytic subunit